jgi:hypothetical protein
MGRGWAGQPGGGDGRDDGGEGASLAAGDGGWVRPQQPAGELDIEELAWLGETWGGTAERRGLGM